MASVGGAEAAGTSEAVRAVAVVGGALGAVDNAGALLVAFGDGRLAWYGADGSKRTCWHLPAAVHGAPSALVVADVAWPADDGLAAIAATEAGCLLRLGLQQGCLPETL
eukprot:CAMPEP_0170307134 /NCGR_PEP_ID=MMETSP0116_2-20130129/53975_1 /TAXON_ID=400756 /ORGANISM="Durinskia baltica, Strain CSIRO CS-38" /LENGTH=108 /DNA_ID=CAMNT_0010559253 /DNA_START=119 /DNA_END=442 /DNA_ORIENTATION=-